MCGPLKWLVTCKEKRRSHRRLGLRINRTEWIKLPLTLIIITAVIVRERGRTTVTTSFILTIKIAIIVTGRGRITVAKN